VQIDVATLIVPGGAGTHQSSKGPEGSSFRAFLFFREVRVVGKERIDARWLAIFEDRHGAGSYDQLIELFQQPCVTFARIAHRFGVTRERVRQWHLRLWPDAPRGHERQRLCGLYHQKRRLLAEPLFRSFYQHARPHLEPGRIALIKSNDVYRTRAVRIDERTVAIREARGLATSRSGSGGAAYSLPRYRGPADFIYYRLTADDYLFLPTRELAAARATFLDRPTSRYQTFKNTFDALHADAGRRRTA
jgi:hypothetical protein